MRRPPNVSPSPARGREEEEFGGKSGIPLSRLPQSVQVITAEELTRQGILSVGDALRDVPGANTGNSRVARYQSFSLKVRGFLADQMRNGLRQRYFEDIDASALSNIERIDVLKGPSAVLFGHSAVGGIISQVTKRPQADFGGELAFSLGSDDWRQASFDLSGTVPKTAVHPAPRAPLAGRGISSLTRSPRASIA